MSGITAVATRSPFRVSPAAISLILVALLGLSFVVTIRLTEQVEPHGCMPIAVGTLAIGGTDCIGGRVTIR
jgi:hypothetical protein